MSEAIIVQARIVVTPDKASDFAGFAEGLVREGADEPGSIVYRISRDLTDHSVFYVYEEWASLEALQAHVATPQAQETVARAAEFGVIGFTQSAFRGAPLPLP